MQKLTVVNEETGDFLNFFLISGEDLGIQESLPFKDILNIAGCHNFRAVRQDEMAEAINSLLEEAREAERREEPFLARVALESPEDNDNRVPCVGLDAEGIKTIQTYCPPMGLSFAPDTRWVLVETS